MREDEERSETRLRQQQQLEQNMQASLEALPAFYWGLYERYQKAGFTKEEAFRMVCCQVAGSVKL